MATNPNNAVGTNGAYGGRTSVNAFNDFMNIVTRGIISGWACAPNSGLTVSLGGSGTVRDSAAAQDNAGNKTSINNISGLPIDVTLSAAPGTNSRIDSIVAYVDNPPNGDSSVADNPDACGIIAVTGSPASSPVAPDDSAIRTAITADGASGTTAYYVVLANITMAAGTTDITSNMIQAGAYATIGSNAIADGAVNDSKINYSTVKKWVPDYSNISSTSYNNVAIPQTGFVYANVSGFNGGNPCAVYIRINNVRVAYGYSEAQAPSGARVATTSGVFPVAAGDVVTLDLDGNNGRAGDVYFIPGKWA